MNKDLVYASNNILIIDDYVYGRFYIIALDDYKLGLNTTRMVAIDTFTNGLTNNDVEDYIEQLLRNTGYDVEEEIENYRNSSLYQALSEND